MLYRFKSQATPDLILLPADGDTVLRLLGKLPIDGGTASSTTSGIITVEQLPAAMATLEHLAAQDRAATRAARGKRLNPPAGEDCEDDIDDVTDAEGDGDDTGVSLAQRLAPFLAMLGHARREGQPVVWGV